jgi:glycosyltransferase involved in cell wall biosynthesis
MTVKKNFKILYVTASLDHGWPGGEPIVARSTIRFLKSVGHNVIATFYKSKSFKPILYLTGQWRSRLDPSDSFIRPFVYYKKIIKKENPDIIISQYDYDCSIVKAATVRKKNIIVYVHIWWPICPKVTLLNWKGEICSGFMLNDCGYCLKHSDQPTSLAFRIFNLFVLFLSQNNNVRRKMQKRIELLNSSNVNIIALTTQMRENFIKNGISAEKIKILPNGINTEEFSPKNISREKIVGYYGGEVYAKGYEVFFKIAEIVKKNYPDVSFVATGNFKNKSPFIDFLGVIDRDVFSSLLARSMCTVIPSIWEEPFPAVALESLASGTPTVAFDVGVLKSIIIDGQNGFIVPVMSIDEIVDRIVKILTNDGLFSKLSENSRRVAYEYTEGKRTSMLMNIINDCL